MRNKPWALVLSVVIAFSLWLYVITVISPGSEKTYYDIPAVLQNENVLTERGLMITSIEDSTVTLQLEGNRTDLNKLNESNINILANVSGIMAPGTHLIRYDINYPGNIPNNAVTTQNKSPDMLTVKVENRITKKVDVKVDYQNRVPAGFLADKENAVLDYPTIEVTGPESVIGKIDSAWIQVDLENKMESIAGAYSYTLCDAMGEPVDAPLVTANVEKVQLNLSIQRYKELALRVNVIDGGGATEKTCSIMINPPMIRISGSDALLDNLDAIELGTINLGEILEDTTYTFPITLPAGVTNITGIHEATVEVKFPDLKMKTLNVTKINAINVPDGLEVDMITQTLSITLRGPVALIDKLKETDITVTVDFAGAQLGTATMNATITMDSPYADIGAVGTYSVTATLRDPVEGASANAAGG